LLPWEFQQQAMMSSRMRIRLQGLLMTGILELLLRKPAAPHGWVSEMSHSTEWMRIQWWWWENNKLVALIGLIQNSIISIQSWSVMTASSKTSLVDKAAGTQYSLPSIPFALLEVMLNSHPLVQNTIWGHEYRCSVSVRAFATCFAQPQLGMWAKQVARATASTEV